MSIIDFLEEKKAQLDYKTICSKMKKLNPNISIDKNGNKTIVSKVGELEYKFNELNQKNVLKLNGVIVFDKEDIYTDTVYNINDVNMIKNVKNHLSNSMDGVLDLKQTIEGYEKITKRLHNVGFNGSHKSSIKDGVIIAENNFDNISYKSKGTLINDELLDVIELKMNDQVVYKVRKTEKGNDYLKIDGSALDQVSGAISNKIDNILKHNNSVKKKSSQNKLRN